MYFVYALTDPRTGTVAYVGITNNAYERFKQHISYRDNNGKKHAWIQRLQQEKVMPAMKILEVVENEEIALDRERYWIKHYKEQGLQLTNLYPPPMRKVEPQKEEISGVSSNTVFSLSTPNDLWAEFTIGRSLYGEESIVPYKRLLEWREVNSTMFMSLKEEGKVVAYSSLMPIREDVILSLLQSRLQERDISPDAVRQWTEPQLSVYVVHVAIKPGGSLLKDRNLEQLVIEHTIEWMFSLDKQYDITNWYGIGTTAEAQHLFESLGFTEIASSHGSDRRGYFLEAVRNSISCEW